MVNFAVFSKIISHYVLHSLISLFYVILFVFILVGGGGGGAADKNGAGLATGIQKTDTLIIM